MNLLDIATGWYNYINGNIGTKQLMDQRLRICETCPNKIQLNQAGQLLITTINEEGSIYKCGLCGCPLAALTANPSSACKDKRWKAFGE